MALFKGKLFAGRNFAGKLFAGKLVIQINLGGGGRGSSPDIYRENIKYNRHLDRLIKDDNEIIEIVIALVTRGIL